MRVFLNQLGIVCSLGEDADTVRQNLLRDDAEGGLSTDLHLAEQPLMLGKVLANRIIGELDGSGKAVEHDSSTAALIRYYRD